MRSWWRHNQQSICMVMSTVSHHSFGKVHTRTEAVGAQYFFLDDEVSPPPGRRKVALAEPRGQEKVERDIANVMEMLAFRDLRQSQMHSCQVVVAFCRHAHCVP